MIRLQFQLERKDDGLVTARVLDYDEGDNPAHLVWECTIGQDTTKGAQEATLKATFTYLNDFLDLTEGGRYY